MKKFFLIPLVALFTCVNVWADSVIAEMSVNGGDPTSYTSMSDLQTAINGLSQSALITLKKTIELSGDDVITFHVPAGKVITLNLNGYNFTQTLPDPCKYYYFGTEIPKSDPSFNEMNNYGLLTKECVEDTDIHQNALIYNQGTLHIISEGNSIVQLINQGYPSTSSSRATVICNAGNLTIDGGIFVGTKDNTELGAMKMPVIWNKTEKDELGNDVTPVVNINGGTFLMDESTSDYNNGTAFYTIEGTAEWHIKGGIFSRSEMTDLLNHPDTKAFIDEHNGETETANYETILVPYTNANIKGYNSWRTDTEKNSSKCVIPACADMEGKTAPDKERGVYQRYRYAVKPVCVVVPKTDRLVVNDDNTTNKEYTLAANDPFKFVYVEPGKKLIVPDTKTLRVNSTSGIILGGTDAKLVVAPGATVISDGDIITSSNDNIELTMDARNNQYSTLAIKANNIQAKHPNATVTLKSVCERSGSTYRWQRFAIPTYQTNMAVSSFVNDETTRVFGWNYDDTGATDGAWQEKSSSDILVPFQGYTMTTMAEGVHPDYTFQCELVGNGNPRIALHPNWNYLANSYTAPLYLDAVLDYLISAENIAVNAGVWAQIEPGTSNWKAISYADVIFGEMPLHKINPMQAFIFSKKAESLATTLDIMYEEYVYTPLTNGTYAAAPRRAPQLYEDITRANIVVKADDNQTETVKLYLSNDFSDSYDNGFDLEKYKNAENFNLYIASPALGDLERIATNNLDNTSITIQTLSAESYTMTFESVTLDGYSIIDNVTKTVTEIKAGNQYEFTAAANSTHNGRFTIILTEDPTAVENVEDAKHIVNGIYSITGVYMGTNFNVLPAGIYVVNGKKVVK